ncbi:MAG: YfiM family protein [Bacteroidia bacterium]|nr:YfiM family protein [Bacteroidia bacterium]
MLRFKFIIALFLIANQFLFASDSLSVFKKRKLTLGFSSLALTSASLTYFNEVWYKEYKTKSLHQFNDNKEWFQLDKCGHAFATYQTGRLMMDAMNWAGYSKKKQFLIGGLSGFTYLAAIELMDGFSDGWGFSWGDIYANALGSGFAIGQKALWNEQRIQIKFSYYNSQYAKYNPKLLGESAYSQFLKDYNGQIYWISINPSSFIKAENKFPKWLNIAFGYGANGMIGANDNSILTENANQIYFNRYRQGYFSLDADLTRIKTKSKFLKSVFSCLNIIKIPFPNLEFSEKKLKFNYY